jgi:hypothetical protein
MAALTDFTADFLADWVVGKTTPSAVATRYITTFSGDPSGAGSENIDTITGSANRIAIAPETYFTSAADASSIASTADIVFTASAAAGATVDYIAIYDAITAGNLMAQAAVTSKTLATGDGLKITSGNLTLAFS